MEKNNAQQSLDNPGAVCSRIIEALSGEQSVRICPQESYRRIVSDPILQAINRAINDVYAMAIPIGITTEMEIIYDDQTKRLLAEFTKLKNEYIDLLIHIELSRGALS